MIQIVGQMPFQTLNKNRKVQLSGATAQLGIYLLVWCWNVVELQFFVITITVLSALQAIFFSFSMLETQKYKSYQTEIC